MEDILTKYCKNLNKYVKETDFQIIGVESYFRQMMKILMRKFNNNPMLVGEPGTGKTALVYGLAQKIDLKQTTENIAKKTIYELNLNAFQAGTKYRGDFEERIDALIKIFSGPEQDKILFIDEFHMTSAAGAGEGGMDGCSKLLNSFKPQLSAGKLTVIGATTEKEYRKYIVEDAALVRRFKKLVCKEPSTQETVTILMGIKASFEKHYGIQIPGKIVPEIVRLAESSKIHTGQAMPAGAITVLEDALSSLKVNLEVKPDNLVELERKLVASKLNRETLKLEVEDSKNPKLEQLSNEIKTLEQEYKKVYDKWDENIKALKELKLLREELDRCRRETVVYQLEGKFDEAGKLTFSTIPSLNEKIRKAEQKLQDKSNVTNVLNKDFLLKAFSESTGVTTNQLNSETYTTVNALSEYLRNRILGQDQAIKDVVDCLTVFLTGLQLREMPISMFLVGPTGTGKTELARMVHKFFFGSSNSENKRNRELILNMSEYSEKFSIASLIGSPPGYSGHREGGVLTEAVRNNPSTVIVFDEIEKAHPTVFNLLLRLLDTGHIRDANGNQFSFGNCIIFFTSNCGQQHFFNAINHDFRIAKGFVYEELRKTFSREFINRLTQIVFFDKISGESVRNIIRLKLEHLRENIMLNKDIDVEFQESVVDMIQEIGYNPDYGARGLERTIMRYVAIKTAEIIVNLTKDNNNLTELKIAREDLVGGKTNGFVVT